MFLEETLEKGNKSSQVKNKNLSRSKILSKTLLSFFFRIENCTGVLNYRSAENENLFFVGEIPAIFKIVIVYEEEMSASFSIFWKNCNTIKRGIWIEKRMI